MGAGATVTIVLNLPEPCVLSPPSFRHFALPLEVALVRLDGQYGDASVVAQIMQAGVYLLTRGRGYRVLEHPQLQRVLAHPPTAKLTRENTAEEVEVFDGGWLPLELEESLPPARVIVARHRAASASKDGESR
jgi:hypothetical protein